MKLKVYVYSISLVFLICKNLLCQPLTWYNEYGHFHKYEYARGVVQTADRGYLVFGTVSIPYIYSYAIILKIDSLGNELWWKSYSPTNNNIQILAFDKTSDGSYILTGSSYNDPSQIKIYLLKIDNDGNKIWDKFLVRENDWVGNSIKQISTGGFIITGREFLAKTNENGDTLWTRTFDHSAYSVCESSDSGFAITGISGTRAFLLKADSNGHELWIKYFGDYSDQHWAWSIQETVDSGFVFVGHAIFSLNEKYAFIIKTDKEGDQIFRKYYSIDKSYGRHVIQLSDSGYAITGYNDPHPNREEIYVLRLDKNGLKVWERSYNPSNRSMYGYYIQQTEDGDFITTGESNGISPTDQIFLLKIDSDGNLTNIKPAENSYANNYNLLQNYPNPFNPTTTIKYQIPELSFVTINVYDVLGNEIATLVNVEKPLGTYEIEFDGTGIPSGIYFYQLKAGNFVDTKKMILIK